MAGYAGAGEVPAAETSQLKGRVCSPDGCGVQGVSLTIVEAATKAEVRVVTGLSGTYQVAGLAPGRYTVKAEAPGFATGVVRDLILGPGEGRTYDIELSFAPLQNVVHVVGTAPRGALQAAEARESAGRDVGEALARIWLGLNNIFDARFYEHLSFFRDPFRSGARVYEPGRNLFLNVDYRF
jgi:hypothetical protein